MDTAEFEVFLVLAEELHFGRTAERLRLPQPRVSRLVAALERRAGGALFERTSRRVRLTPLGQQLASQLRPAYVQLTAALADARAAARREAGVLRIGFSPTSNMAPLTRLAEAFEARHPGSRAAARRCAASTSWCRWWPAARSCTRRRAGSRCSPATTSRWSRSPACRRCRSG